MKSRTLWALVLIGCLTPIVGVWAADQSGPSPSISVPEHSERVLALTPADSETLQLNQVTIGEGATLVLPPFKSVNIQKLIAADGARIRLSHNGDGGNSPEGVEAAPGGNARFFFQEVTGHIVIESRGGDGGAGTDGRNGRQGQEGKDGRKARTLILGLFYLGDGEDGLTGGPGEDGENGGDGGKGGLGGNITVYYVKKADFAEILLDVAGGQAGRAGAAGLGGLGGNGGRGGKGIKNGEPGLMGKNGKSGKPGNPGQPGVPGQAFVYQVEPTLFDCLSKLAARSEVDDLSDEDYSECRDLCHHEGDANEAAFQVVSGMPDRGLESSEVAADGQLILNADGASGQDAAPVRTFGATPSNGTMGASGGHLTLVVRELPRQAFISARGGKGGSGAQGGNGEKGTDGFDGRDATLFHKARKGTNGGDGGNAANGSSGGDGGKGGLVRIVYLIPQDSEIDPNWRGAFQVDVAGGDGGLPGAGGRGGRAGKGGQGGSKFWKNKDLADGRDGKSGANGLAGTRGANGDYGQVEFLEADSFADWIVDDFRAQSEALFKEGALR